MNDSIAFIISNILIVGAVSVSIMLFLLAVYDLILARHTAQAKISPLPTITVIIMSTGGADEINDCLKSVRMAKYRKLDTVIVRINNRRSELALSKALIKKYRHVKQYTPRKNYSYSRLMQAAYRRSERGSIVVVIDSHLRFSDGVFSAIAHHRDIIQKNHIIRLQHRSNVYGFAGVILSIKASSKRIYEKLRSVLRVPRSKLQTQRCYVLPGKLLLKSLENYSLRLHDDLEVITQPRLSIAAYGTSHKKYITRLLGLGVILFIASAMTQSAVAGSGLEAATISWLLVAISSTLIVIFDAHTNLRQKIEAAVCFGFMPILALIAYATSTKHSASS